MLGIDRYVGRAIGVDDVAGFEDGVEPLSANLRARDHRRDFLFFDHLPIDEFLDVRVIQIQTHHLGGAPRGAPRLDGAGGAVSDAEKRHEAR